MKGYPEPESLFNHLSDHLSGRMDRFQLSVPVAWVRRGITAKEEHRNRNIDSGNILRHNLGIQS